MTVCAIAPERLASIKEMFPNTVYWKLQHGEGEAFAVRAEDGTAYAVLAAELNQDTVRLLWLWVAPAQRRQGLATLLFATLFSGGQDAGAVSLEMELPATENYEEMLSFLLRISGEVQCTDSVLLSTTLGEVDLGIIGKQVRREAGIPLGNLEPWQMQEVSRVLLMQDMPAQSEYIMQCFDPDLSRMCFHADKLCAMLLAESGAHLSLAYLWCGDGWSQVLPGLLSSCLQQAAAHYPAETPLHTAATVPAAYRLAKAFMPAAKEYPVMQFRYPIG